MSENHFLNSNPWASSAPDEPAMRQKKSDQENRLIKEGSPAAPLSPTGPSPEIESIDFDKLTSALSEDPPHFPTPTAESLSGFANEQEVSNWATSSAMSDPKLSRWRSLAKGAIEEISLQKQRLQTRRSRLNSKLENEPDEITVPVKLDEFNLGGPVLFTRNRSFILVGVLAALSVASILLGFEFIFEKEVALQSDWGFAQSEWGARGLVFAISFGSFFALSFWMYAEKFDVHWAVRLVSRTGAKLSVIGVTVIGFALGSTHVEEGARFGWPMLIVPISAGTLICAAMGAKELAVWIGKLAFPMRKKKNPALELMAAELNVIDKPLGKFILQQSNALELSKRTETVTQEYESRVLAHWRSLKKYEKVQSQSRDAARSKALADVEATLAQQAFEELKQPE
ncbi:hypothetical protein [Polystyrenella longa]|uniref:hypothetical protein n=1 Tax=Polystyrenella longa TaxID=2528007 RepID=UPI0011A5F35F|nr:hypothetical protein [Polystyrenella longa]